MHGTALGSPSGKRRAPDAPSLLTEDRQPQSTAPASSPPERTPRAPRDPLRSPPPAAPLPVTVTFLTSPSFNTTRETLSAPGTVSAARSTAPGPSRPCKSSRCSCASWPDQARAAESPAAAPLRTGALLVIRAVVLLGCEPLICPRCRPAISRRSCLRCLACRRPAALQGAKQRTRQQSL